MLCISISTHLSFDHKYIQIAAVNVNFALSFLLSAFCANRMVNTVQCSMLLNAYSMCVHQIPRKCYQRRYCSAVNCINPFRECVPFTPFMHSSCLFCFRFFAKKGLLLNGGMAGAWWILKIQFYRFNLNQFTSINPQRSMMALKTLVWEFKYCTMKWMGHFYQIIMNLSQGKPRHRKFTHFECKEIIRMPMNGINIRNNKWVPLLWMLAFQVYLY